MAEEAKLTPLSKRRKVNLEMLDEAVEMACYFFQIEKLLPDQLSAIKAFVTGKNIYFSAPTGYGKSLIFQTLPLIFDVLRGNLIGTCKALVISPLNSLMIDQVTKLKQSSGVTAAAIYKGQDSEVLADIENGDISIIYASPESILGNDRWRRMLASPHFQENCEILVIDEAHCVVHWGTTDSGEQKNPFRHWYGNLLELISLLDKPRTAVFTATASKTTKRKIFELLQLSIIDTKIFEKNPIKENLRFAVCHVGNDLSLREIFSDLIHEIKEKKEKTMGTLIFCTTRKQCSQIYQAFLLSLGDKVYLGQEKDDPRKRMMEMFHAGTPESVRTHILSQVTSGEGHIRILICTVAFGMGVNCKYMSRVIHFGASRCMESYLQECGRAGRNGELSTCYLYHNGILMKRSGEDMKDYVISNTCRRKEITKTFPDTTTNSLGCACCDICLKDCPCGSCNFPETLLLRKEEPEGDLQCRTVSECEKELLIEQLRTYMRNILPDEIKSCTPVSYPNIFCEFGHVQLSQVIEHCDKIFTLADVKKYVEIWRNVHANNILLAIHDIFKDFDINSDDLEVIEDLEFDDDIESDWAGIRDDTDALNFDSCTFLEQIEAMDISVDENEPDADSSAVIDDILAI
eukprot:gene21152-23232_t